MKNKKAKSSKEILTIKKEMESLRKERELLKEEIRKSNSKKEITKLQNQIWLITKRKLSYCRKKLRKLV